MRTISIRLDDLEKTTLQIGFVGENLHRQVRIDSTKMYEEYPTAAASLTVNPPHGDPYPAVVVRDGNVVVWDITDSDLIYPGSGQIQLAFTVDEVVAKSYKGRTKILDSIEATGEVPDPLDDFLTRAGAALTAIPETIDEALAEAKASGEFDGADGVSPTVTITSIVGGHRVTITDAEQTQTVDVMDGEDGDTGVGIASISKTGTSGLIDTYTITYTNGNSTTFTVTNGKDGQDGKDGVDGYTPVRGVDYWTEADQENIDSDIASHAVNVVKVQDSQPTAPETKIWLPETPPQSVQVASYAELTSLQSAINGMHTVPSGGSSGQVLGKASGDDYDVEWKTVSGGGAVDSSLSTSSTNPVQNKVIAEKIEQYDDVLLMRTNQLLDYKNCTQHSATMSSSAGMSTSTHGKVAVVPISVDANTTITVHRTIVGKRFSIGLSTSANPAIGESIRAYTEGNNNAELSLTATSSDKTLLIYYYLDTQDTTYTAEHLLSAIMVNYGAYIGYEPYLADAFISKKESEYSLVLGEEMFPSSAPTWEGDGWQENTSKQYTHISGGDYQPLKISIPQIKADTPYLLEFDIESNTSTGSPDDSNAVYPSLRGSTPFSIYYGYTGNVHYSFTIFTGTSGSLATTTLDFQPCSATVPSIKGRSFDGTIKNISLKEVLSVRNTNHFMLDQNGKKTVMMIQTEESLRNTLIGFESGRYVSTGYENVALGNKALRRLTSGYWNVGIGAFALEKCAEGSRNIAIGYNALQENTGGDRNVAIGSYALCRNWGFRNVAIGADCLWYNTKGYQNVAIGMATLHSNTEGNNNAAYGVHALHDNVTGNENVGIGSRAGYHSTGDKNTAVGYDADITGGKSNVIVIGHGARATKNNQMVIGNANNDELVIAGKVISFNNDGTVTWTAQS